MEAARERGRGGEVWEGRRGELVPRWTQFRFWELVGALQTGCTTPRMDWTLLSSTLKHGEGSNCYLCLFHYK